MAGTGRKSEAGRGMAIYITGDTHGRVDLLKLRPEYLALAGVGIGEGDYLIICGDVGAVWGKDYHDRHLQEWYAEQPFTTLFIDGNHENHEALNYDYEVSEMFGGSVHAINDHLIHLMRGEYYAIEGKTFWCMGGAWSIDKDWRTPYISWWPEEIPSVGEQQHGMDTLAEHGRKVDVILTHDCPTSILYAIDSDYKARQFNSYLDEIRESVDFKKWYFGHYHIDKEFDDKRFRCLYDDVVVLDLARSVHVR